MQCGTAGIYAVLSKARMVEHDADEIWATMLGVAVEAMTMIGASAKRYRSDRDHESERDDDRVG